MSTACRPRDSPWLPKADILSYEEIAEVVRQLAPLGLRRLRITGGEPTIRPDLDRLVRMLRAVPEIEDIALSTNGVRLPASLRRLLRASGLDRVNMSADSLRRIGSRRSRGATCASIPIAAALAAEAAGLTPIKINMVVMRGINDDESRGLRATHARAHPWHVRFIELMPVGDMRELTWDHVVPSDEVVSRVAALGLAADVQRARAGQRARASTTGSRVRPGSVGVITPMTHTYCASCNRVRLTADGRLRTCLFGDHEVDLRGPLRAGEPLEPAFRAALADKPLEHDVAADAGRRLARALASWWMTA